MYKAIDKWFWGYLKSVLRREYSENITRHLIFCVADHFEPFVHHADKKEAQARTKRWVKEYPKLVQQFIDVDGISPRHTFFYPAEQYDEEILNMLGQLTTFGMGEVEIHLHHQNDTAENMRKTIMNLKEILHGKHGLLGEDNNKNVRYGFIHGNWALCNSLPEGEWCGVNEEIIVLTETGCYADFTFPSAPSPSQPRMVNSIYRAINIEGQPRSHDYGNIVIKGLRGGGKGLMIIEGPLAFNWEKRKWKILPSIENSEISAGNVISTERIDLWVRQNITVSGKSEWVFVKVHMHGALPENTDVLLEKEMKKMHLYLQEKYNEGEKWKLHYVSAREMYNIIRAAEDGCEGSPGEYRNYEIKPPPIVGKTQNNYCG